MFGAGYVFSNAVGFVAGLVSSDPDVKNGAKLLAATLALPFDPLGAGATFAMHGVKTAAKNGNTACKVINAGVTACSVTGMLSNVADIADGVQQV